MGYRINEHKPPHPQRTLVDLNTPSRIYVNQGVIAHLAFPCWYQEVHKPIPVHPHNRHLHDCQGWSSPGHPDHSCQLWAPDLHCCSIGHHHECPPHCKHYIDMNNVVPIHLLEEGYDADAFVYIDGELQTEHTKAWIDENDDWVIRLLYDATEDEAYEDPIVHDLSIYIQRQRKEDEDLNHLRFDLAVHARLVVLPVNADFSEED